MKPKKVESSGKSAAKAKLRAEAEKKVKKAPPAETAPQEEKKAELKIPSVLLQGDTTSEPQPSGPGQRYALGPNPPAEHFAETALPESYGTGQLFLTARDPHWLYAAWDFSLEQVRKFNALSTDGHLVLRIYLEAIKGEPLAQIHVHPESRNWFAPVPHAASKYMAELGYYDLKSKWTSVSSSGATLTPPDAMAEDMSVQFATIPADVPFAYLLAMIKAALREHIPLVEALQQLRAAGVKNLPGPAQISSGEWTPAQEQALAQAVSMDKVRRVWIGSLEVTELVRRQLEQQVSSITAAQLGLPSSPVSAFASAFSPYGRAEQKRGFWFNVNAELIIYGATDPEASVTIAGRQIKLRRDGSFSFRFALPDGQYALPAVATSPDGEETRGAHLNFSRATRYDGSVGAHPQDPQLKAPVPEAVA